MNSMSYCTLRTRKTAERMRGTLPRHLTIRLVTKLSMAVFLFLLATPQSSNGMEFQVSGEVETETFIGNQGVQTDTFEVFVRDDNWLIKIHQQTFPSFYTNGALWDYSSFNDGNCVYTFAAIRNPKEVINKLLASPKAPAAWQQHPDRIAINMAWLETASVPHADMSYPLQVVFYAFCSQFYLDSVTDHRLEPPYFVDGRVYSYDDGATNVLANYSRFESSPFLPQTISFMHGDKWLGGPGVWYSLPKKWAGFTNAEFLTSETTNLGGLLLPSKFEMTVYEADQVKLGGRLVVTPQSRIRGILKTAKAKCDLGTKQLKPSPGGYASITDKRIRSEGLFLPVQYETNRWLSMAEIMQLPEYGYAVREHSAMLRRLAGPRTNTYGRLMFVALLVVSTALLLILLLRRLRKRPMADGQSSSA